MSENVNINGGIGLAGALFIVFLIFKILGTITWSWWWIFAPLWIPWAMLICGIIIAFIIMIVVEIFKR